MKLIMTQNLAIRDLVETLNSQIILPNFSICWGIWFCSKIWGWCKKNRHNVLNCTRKKWKSTSFETLSYWPMKRLIWSRQFFLDLMLLLP